MATVTKNYVNITCWGWYDGLISKKKGNPDRMASWILKIRSKQISDLKYKNYIESNKGKNIYNIISHMPMSDFHFQM